MTTSTLDRTGLDLGPLRIDTPVVLAPMAGVTDLPFRRLCRRFGAGLYVNQMITARGLVEGYERTLKLAEFGDEEWPRSIQLYGIDAHWVGEAVHQLVGERGVDHIDLNFGCPAKKVTKAGGGAAIPYKGRLLAAIIQSAVTAAGSVPVTVKFRLGIDDDHLTHLQTGRIAEDLGCAAVALHARTAEQHYAGEARWAAIAELKATVTSIPVLGNGDIWEADDARRMIDATGCDGVVIGRGCLGRPWLFRDLAALFAGEPVPTPPTLGDVADTMADHARLVVDWAGEDALRSFRKHAVWYLTGYPAGPAVRRALHQVTTLDELDTVLAGLDRTTPMPAGAMRIPRSHTSGPHAVALPAGWLDDPDELPTLGDDAGRVTSGG
ncbi:MAG: tRNA dihydrouridine synthase DusB [Acidimicrobiia bacterium]|nr:tRNA dihydrouridine synthase DusB [Acidimicrobiia bacterium]